MNDATTSAFSPNPDTPAASLGAQHSPLSRLHDRGTLRRRILGGQYDPGERLVENTLSQELGVSRIPVREALRALAAEGLVKIEPRRGASVARLSPNIAREMVEVRATLEGLNAKLAAQRRDPALILEIEKVLKEGNDAVNKAASTERFVELNPVVPRTARQYRRQQRAAGHDAFAARTHRAAVRAGQPEPRAGELGRARPDSPGRDCRRCRPGRAAGHAPCVQCGKSCRKHERRPGKRAGRGRPNRARNPSA